MVRHSWRGAFLSCQADTGAKRHMPSLHAAQPQLQSHSLAAHSEALCSAAGVRRSGL